MVNMHSKSFPYKTPGGFVEWKEFTLNDEEIRQILVDSFIEHEEIMKNCIGYASNIENDKESIIKLAVAFFKKRAKHVTFYLDDACREKFEQYKMEVEHDNTKN